MRATIVYYSRRGRTAGYAREMAMYLWSKGADVKLVSVSDFKPEFSAEADCLLLGCWTAGYFVLGQHPHRQWSGFARSLPEGPRKPVLLFTTYKFRTGSMFRSMQRCLPEGLKTGSWRLSSRTGQLSSEDKTLLDDFIECVSHPGQPV